MAETKHQHGRYQVIDKLLSTRDRVKTSEIQKAILYDLEIKVSAKTINNDINDMISSAVLGYYAPIKKDTSKKAYYYSDPDYTIKAFGLKEADINALQFYANAINQYKEYEVFRNFSSAIEKILDAVTIRKGLATAEQAKAIVQTERAPFVTGSHWIPKIVEAININSFIGFDYQKFDNDEPKAVKLQPYLLKEDRHLWYVLGRNHKGRLITYALDRINRLDILDDKFVPDNVDFEDYFKYSFGITVNDVAPVIVILSFTVFQGKYVKALPIHPTQKILIDNNEELRISVDVKPSYEFYEKMLGYGAKVKIISPPAVIFEIKTKIEEASKRYK